MQSEYLSIGNKISDSYRFDVGPSLLLLPDIYDKTFKLLGASSLDQYIDLIEVKSPQYRVLFEGEESEPFDISRDSKSMEESFNKMEKSFTHINSHPRKNLFQQYQVSQNSVFQFRIR
jgi:phytoene desaturase